MRRTAKRNRKSHVILLAVICIVLIIFLNLFILPRGSWWTNSKQYGEVKRGMKRVVVVLGTRPEAIKLAPLISEFRSKYTHHIELVVVSTGQHYEMLRQSLEAFSQNIDVSLDLMIDNQDPSNLFSLAFDAISTQLRIMNPVDMVVVQGDTTTTLAAAIAAGYQGIDLAHVEAGLRTYNLKNPHPEEINRKVVDSFSKLMFAPTTFAKEALLREGACESDVHVTGNTGIDAFQSLIKRRPKEDACLKMIVNFKKSIKNAKIILVTMHRRENIDFFGDMCDAIIDISKKYVDNAMVILPVHLNPNVKNVVTKKLFGIKNVKIVNPIPYDVFPHVILESHVIMTDSGGIQEEASSIGKPVILMRATTERPEGTFQGSIKQIGTNRQEIIDACTEAISMNKAELSSNLFGDGQASVRIAKIINLHLMSANDNKECSTKARQNSIAEAVYKPIYQQ